MGIGKQSAGWRRALYASFASIYFRRSGKTVDGIFDVYVSPGSSLKVLDFRQPLLDAVHDRFIRRWVQHDSIVWDIGANLGLFAFPAALKSRGGEVYAFEPDINLAANLLRSRKLNRNHDLHLSVVCVAVSNADGVAKFQISKFSRALNKLEGAGNWHEDLMEVAELRSVPMMRIDTLVESLPPPTVLKIDVEGAEMEVLEGGEGTIAALRPTMLIEGPKEIWEPMRAFFERHRYVLLDGAVDNPSPLACPVWDTVAVPAEKYSCVRQT